MGMQVSTKMLAMLLLAGVASSSHNRKGLFTQHGTATWHKKGNTFEREFTFRSEVKKEGENGELGYRAVLSYRSKKKGKKDLVALGRVGYAEEDEVDSQLLNIVTIGT